jgi:hypothetical protein
VRMEVIIELDNKVSSTVGVCILKCRLVMLIKSRSPFFVATTIRVHSS